MNNLTFKYILFFVNAYFCLTLAQKGDMFAIVNLIACMVLAYSIGVQQENIDE